MPPTDTATRTGTSKGHGKVRRGPRDTTTLLSSVMATFRPAKQFRRETKDRPPANILSIDFNDPGDLCMTTESDNTIQIYNVREGRHSKTLYSKKYGAKLARFTHWTTNVVYASTMQNDAIRYLAAHDNSFIRYFEGHEASVTSISMHPGTDDFVSTSLDSTVRLWNVANKRPVGVLNITKPQLSAWDPSGIAFAIASPAAGSVLIYDYRNFTSPPFCVFDVVQQCSTVDQRNLMAGWTSLAFSNDGAHLLIGTRGAGHYLLDALNGSLLAFLRKSEGPTRRAPFGEDHAPGVVESAADCCFSSDGRYVLGGGQKNVQVWDLLDPVGDDKTIAPSFVLEDQRESALVAFNPRYNHFVTADQSLIFWRP